MKYLLKRDLVFKFRLFSVCLMFIFISFMPPEKGYIDFSGKWNLNAVKSEFGDVPKRAAVQKFFVIQKKDSIYIDRIIINANGDEVASNERVSFDGRPCSSLLKDGRTKVTTINWSPDKLQMTTVSTYSEPGNSEKSEYSLKMVWSLMSNKKNLVIVLTSSSYTITAVYDKV